MGAKAEVSTNGAVLSPDYSFMLVCDTVIRSERVKRRARERTIWDEIETENIEEINRRYLANDFPQIDTSQLATGEVIDRIISHIAANPLESKLLRWS